MVYQQLIHFEYFIDARDSDKITYLLGQFLYFAGRSCVVIQHIRQICNELIALIDQLLGVIQIAIRL